MQGHNNVLIGVKYAKNSFPVFTIKAILIRRALF